MATTRVGSIFVLGPLFAVGLSLAAPSGCGGYEPPTMGACADGIPTSDKDCEGERFEADDRCFETLKAACECLSCPIERCTESGSDPADVSCEPFGNKL